MSRLPHRTRVSTLAIALGLLCLVAGEAFAQQLAPPPPSAKPKIETLPTHVPIMLWGHDSPWLQRLGGTGAPAAAATEPSPAAAEPKAEPRVIEVKSEPGSDRQTFSFRDITDRSQPAPEVVPMAERSRAVQLIRHGLMDKLKSTGGARQ